jgi:TfoX/Sxy family transcriptional regulator of competence genes
MASDRSFAERVLQKLEPLEIDARPMFGEFGIFYKGKMFGLICDNTFFIRVTESGSQIAGRIGRGYPYPGAKPAYKISAAKMNDRDWLFELIEATADELPLPKKKKKRTS